MAVQLSWDLHVHPGPSSVPRWGTGAEVQAAAKRAGVKGFVWKSHEHHTARDCSALPELSPRAIGSASLNAWATPASVAEAIADGARWVWGATYAAGGVDWDLPLREDWPAFAKVISDAQQPLVLATGHLNQEARVALARFAEPLPHVICSITHSLYLDAAEVRALHAHGASFEVDLYTATHAIHGRPAFDLAASLLALHGEGVRIYLTTDCGQLAVGNPYKFSAVTLSALEEEIGSALLTELAIQNPAAIAAHAICEAA